MSWIFACMNVVKARGLVIDELCSWKNTLFHVVLVVNRGTYNGLAPPFRRNTAIFVSYTPRVIGSMRSKTRRCNVQMLMRIMREVSRNRCLWWIHLGNSLLNVKSINFTVQTAVLVIQMRRGTVGLL